MKRIRKLHADARTNCFRWYRYSSWFIRFCAFKIRYCKRQPMYCFLPFGFINVIIFLVNSFTLIQHSLEQIWSAPVHYVTTGVADLGWHKSISNQVWNCYGLVHDITPEQFLVTLKQRRNKVLSTSFQRRTPALY